MFLTILFTANPQSNVAFVSTANGPYDLLPSFMVNVNPDLVANREECCRTLS